MFIVECHFCLIRLNNRKARLARTAAKDVRPVAADVDNQVSDRQRGPTIGSHGSAVSAGIHHVEENVFFPM